MTKGEFLTTLRREIHAVAEVELDPTGIRVFYPDGTVVSASTVAGLLAAVAAKANASKANP